LVVKVRYDKNVHKLPASAQLSHWLKDNNLPEFELTSKFLQHKISPDSLKYIKHTDLIDIGIKEWGLRTDILQAIKKTFETMTIHPHPPMPVDQQLLVPGGYVPAPTKRKQYEATVTETTFLPARKKTRTSQNKNRKIKFKDLRSLVMDDMIPVDIGSPVRCSGSQVHGVVVRNKQKKPVIRYILKSSNKKKNWNNFTIF